MSDDKVINAAVRRVLTSLWVDITLVNVRTTRGVVYLNGQLQRMTASHSDLNVEGLGELDRRLRGIPGVRDVQYVLTNWQRNLQGDWNPVLGGTTSLPTS